ncbi:hypothetical protein ACFYYR_23905 [Streptomyces sp. NPDC001922]|uniref:hypothetical protein n=1 Tax=Streptomyces sp. NPDC001922 TaxID=3364624 RepID=UPI003699CF81
MSITQQYALDLYRAARRGETAPPAPGAAEARALHAFREVRRFRAAVERALGRTDPTGPERARAVERTGGDTGDAAGRTGRPDGRGDTVGTTRPRSSS